MLSPANSARTPCSLATTASPCTGRAQRSHDHMKGPPKCAAMVQQPSRGRSSAAAAARRGLSAPAAVRSAACQTSGGGTRAGGAPAASSGWASAAGRRRSPRAAPAPARRDAPVAARPRPPACSGWKQRSPGALQGPGRPHPSAFHQPLVGKTKGAVLGPRHHAMRPVKHICDLRRCGPQS